MKYEDLHNIWLMDGGKKQVLVQVFDKEKFLINCAKKYAEEIHALPSYIPMVLEIADMSEGFLAYRMTNDTAKYFSRKWSGSIFENSPRIESLRLHTGNGLDVELMI